MPEVFVVVRAACSNAAGDSAILDSARSVVSFHAERSKLFTRCFAPTEEIDLCFEEAAALSVEKYVAGEDVTLLCPYFCSAIEFPSFAQHVLQRVIQLLVQNEHVAWELALQAVSITESRFVDLLGSCGASAPSLRKTPFEGTILDNATKIFLHKKEDVGECMDFTQMKQGHTVCRAVCKTTSEMGHHIESSLLILCDDLQGMSRDFSAASYCRFFVSKPQPAPKSGDPCIAFLYDGLVERKTFVSCVALLPHRFACEGTASAVISLLEHISSFQTCSVRSVGLDTSSKVERFRSLLSQDMRPMFDEVCNDCQLVCRQLLDVHAQQRDKDSVLLSTPGAWLINLDTSFAVGDAAAFCLSKQSATVCVYSEEDAMCSCRAEDILLRSPSKSIRSPHVSFTNDGTRVVIRPEDTTGATYVNGSLLTRDRILNHNDRLILGTEYAFRFVVVGGRELHLEKNTSRILDWEHCCKEFAVQNEVLCSERCVEISKALEAAREQLASRAAGPIIYVTKSAASSQLVWSLADMKVGDSLCIAAHGDFRVPGLGNEKAFLHKNSGPQYAIVYNGDVLRLFHGSKFVVGDCHFVLSDVDAKLAGQEKISASERRDLMKLASEVTDVTPAGFVAIRNALFELQFTIACSFDRLLPDTLQDPNAVIRSALWSDGVVTNEQFSVSGIAQHITFLKDASRMCLERLGEAEARTVTSGKHCKFVDTPPLNGGNKKTLHHELSLLKASVMDFSVATLERALVIARSAERGKTGMLWNHMRLDLDMVFSAFVVGVTSIPEKAKPRIKAMLRDVVTLVDAHLRKPLLSEDDMVYITQNVSKWSAAAAQCTETAALVAAAPMPNNVEESPSRIAPAAAKPSVLQIPKVTTPKCVPEARRYQSPTARPPIQKAVRPLLGRESPNVRKSATPSSSMASPTATLRSSPISFARSISAQRSTPRLKVGATTPTKAKVTTPRAQPTSDLQKSK